ncbi:putative proteasome subunit alpha type-1 [Trypanosoma cruzi]|uniref:Putative proteasome subunit alpha type-1 n=1 Tax=Trypanosoma cruzi TaxID=5693 RepID=A0A2V2WS10_TRYCR|nr:putative proteasome subunit alpha type-1 [Trypanosoma cruzi]
MGLRSQAARTYLEKHFESFPDCGLDELIMHALKALAAATSGGAELNIKNTTIAIVGKGTPFMVLTEEAARKYLDGFKMRPEDIPPAPEAEEEETLQERSLMWRSERDQRQRMSMKAFMITIIIMIIIFSPCFFHSPYFYLLSHRSVHRVIHPNGIFSKKNPTKKKKRVSKSINYIYTYIYILNVGGFCTQ